MLTSLKLPFRSPLPAMRLGGESSVFEQLSRDSFAAHLNSDFRVQVGQGGAVELELIELREGRAISGHDVFSLTFRGPLDAFLGQGMVSMSHDALGEFELFIVPIAQTPDGFLYEAVFNRLRSQ